MIPTRMSLRDGSRRGGFTLIEVVIALVILGGSLVVLLGLQSSIIERTIRDSKKQRAMLLARQILSAIEVAQTPPVPQSTDGSFKDVLNSVLTSNETNREESPEDAEYHAQLEVESVGIPKLAPDAIRKITVTISWSPSPLDQLTAVFFTPSD